MTRAQRASSDDAGFDRGVVRRTYSSMAERYVATYGDDLERLDLDRHELDEVASRVGGRGPVLDIGCGPAQAAGYLRSRGCEVIGVDPAPGMLAVARRRNPDTAFAAGEVGGLPVRRATCTGAVVLWVLHHIPRPALPTVLGELRRALATGAPLLLATHAGPGVFTATGIDGAEITGTLYADDELERALIRAGFAVDAIRHRDPLPHERQGDRVLVSATAV